MNQIKALADRFVVELRSEITSEEFLEVCRRNSDPEQPKGVCASHDFCDANMTMHRAFVAVVGREPIIDESAISGADTALWNAAWDYAHETKLRERQSIEYVDRMGFRVEIEEDDGDVINFYPAGGGFLHRMPREKFFEAFSEAPSRTLRRGLVDADWFSEDDLPLSCWSDGSSWNGWSMPHFERAAVEELIRQSQSEELSPMRWDGDAVIVHDSQDNEDVRVEPTTMPNGEKAWAIGAGWWCWNRVRFDDEEENP
jgi:hypothetical protein